MDLEAIKNKTLVTDEETDWQLVQPGIWRKIMSYNEAIMLVKVKFEKGAIGVIHQHPHLQMSYIAEGEFEVSMGHEKRVLRAGDVYFAPSGLEHGVVCTHAGILIDVFTPARQDFLT